MSTRAASRYALAILDSRPGDVPLETLLQDLTDVRASIAASRDLMLFFMSPVISRQHKRDGIRMLFDGKLNPYTIDVLLLLVDKQRENVVLEIIDAVYELHRRREGIITSRVTSAVEIPDEQRKRLVDALRNVSGKQIEVEYITDPDIMAGLVVRLDDTVYDGSVRRQLQRLRARFISGT